MKKMELFLCFAMLLGLFGCTGGDAPAATTGAAPTTTEQTVAEKLEAFSVGYAREDVTPTEDGVILDGWGDSDHRSQGVKDPICVTCVSLSDTEGNTVLFYTLDFCSVKKSYTNAVRKAVSKETGVPVENIYLVATHNHSAPTCTSGTSSVAVQKAAIKTAQEALETRSAAQIQISSIETEGLNFVRHYLTDKGTYVGDNYGIHTGVKAISHETEADRELQVIRFAREEGKDVVIVNFQAHPHLGAGNKMISSDIIGSCRMEFEKRSDCHFAYFQGAAGNLNPSSYISSENFTNDYVAHGKELARYAVSAMNNNAVTVEPGPIKITTQTYTATVRKPTAEYAAAAAAFLAEWNQSNNREKALIASGGIVHSNLAIGNMNVRNRMGDSTDFEIGAVSVGDISFAIAPYEMFDTQGMFIKDNSPFAMTFIMGYCNDMNFYMPSELSFENGCYEVDNSYYVKGTAEDLANRYVAMLNELKG